MPQPRNGIPRTHEHRRMQKRRLLRILMLLALIAMVSFVLRYLFTFGDYAPKFYEPKDREREQKPKQK